MKQLSIMLLISSIILASWTVMCVVSEKTGMYDLATAPRHCQDAPPVTSNYTPTGREWQLGDMTIYETADNSSRRVLIDVYDIFGFHPNTKQVADILAKEGHFRIVMPDYFRGSPFNIHNFPPKNRSEIWKFIKERGDWEDTVKRDTEAVINHFKSTENITSFGIFGFCWGGKITVQAASNLKEIKVAGVVHPASIMTDEAYRVQSAMYLLPSKNEPDMLPFYQILQDRGIKSGHRRFENLPHGFAGARGNFSDPENIKGVNEVITTLQDFFTNNLI